MLFTPRRSVAPPPPCWCGRSWQAHEDVCPVHQYVPADGLESEAFDAW
jgi:hypothetical protein